MRVDVKKFLFIGFQGDLQEFFEKSQEAGLVHFIDNRQLKTKEVPKDIQQVANAIKIVKELPTVEQKEPENLVMADLLSSEIVEIKHRIEQLEEENRVLKLEISRIQVFGNFSLEDLEYLETHGRRVVQFFFGKRGSADEQLPNEVIFITSEHGLDYFVAINKEAVQYPNLVEMKIDEELQVLRKKLKQNQHAIHLLEEKLKGYSQYNDFLHYALNVKYNDFDLETAKSYTRELPKEKLFAIDGWVPANKIEELKNYLLDAKVHLTEIAVEEGEEPPTYLENSGAGRIGEDLVYIYDTPSNRDKDPSLWVLCSFALFFAMIINDGGYGLLFLAAALYYRFKNRRLTKLGTRMWKLLTILFSFCVIWGVLTHSFFGMKIAPDSSIRRVSLLNWLVEKKAAYHFELKDATYQEWVQKFPGLAAAASPEEFLVGSRSASGREGVRLMKEKLADSVLMELALLIGIIHICLSFLRYLKRNWAGIGWVIAIIGGYLYFPFFLGGSIIVNYVFYVDRMETAYEGKLFIYAGLSAALILGVLKDKWMGLLEITNLIQIFADILSYLRLYALGLAGAIIGQTVNDIAGSLMYVPALALIFIGHGLNMVLAVIGGVIHGLRLNFIEWYHWSFDGGGKLFTPLKKLETD